MKKVLIFFMIVTLTMLLCAVPVMAQKAEWTVGSYPVITIAEGVRKQYDEYFLWYGTPEQKKLYTDYAARRVLAGLYFLHMGNDIKMTCEKDPKGWYVFYYDSQSGTSKTLPVYGDLWSTVPALVKQTLSALDETDPDLLLIYSCMISKTIKVFYHPKYQTDKKFYKKMQLRAVSGFLVTTPSRLI